MVDLVWLRRRELKSIVPMDAEVVGTGVLSQSEQEDCAASTNTYPSQKLDPSRSTLWGEIVSS